VQASNGQYFSSWSNLLSGYDATWQNKSSFDLTYPYDYSFLGLTALSYVKCEPGGAAAWNIAETDILPAPSLNTDPKFAIIARDCSGPTTSVAEGTSSENEFEVYPNPSNGQFTVAGLEKQSFIEVYNCFGQKVYESKTSNQNALLDLSSYSSGTYFIRANQKDSWSLKPIIIR
jgi:hypothetical protein